MTSEWIPVEKRLPEAGVDVLVCYEGSMWVGQVSASGQWHDDLGRLNCEHWMPLPQPPQACDTHQLTSEEREAICLARTNLNETVRIGLKKQRACVQDGDLGGATAMEKSISGMESAAKTLGELLARAGK